MEEISLISFFISCHDSLGLINTEKKKKRKRSPVRVRAISCIHLSGVCMANFSLCFCSSLTSWGWINLSVREEPGSAARDQGSSPSLYRVTHPIPPARFTAVLGAPPLHRTVRTGMILQMMTQSDSPDKSDLSNARCSKHGGLWWKLLAAVSRLKWLLMVKSWRFKMLIETAEITLTVET